MRKLPESGVEAPKSGILKWARRGFNAALLAAIMVMSGHNKDTTTTGCSNLLEVSAILTEPVSEEAIVLVKERLHGQESHITTDETGVEVLILKITEQEKYVFEAALLGHEINKFEAWFKDGNNETTQLTVPVSEIIGEFNADIFRLRFVEHGFQAYPDSSHLEADKKELKKKGGQPKQVEALFGSGNPIPILRDSNWGDLVPKMVSEGKMVKVPDVGAYHLLGDIYSEQDPDLSEEIRLENKERAKHVYKVSYDILEGMGKYIDDELRKNGMWERANFKIPVGAIIRTQDYSDNLADVKTTEGVKKYPLMRKVEKDKKGNVISGSSHIKGFAIDATFSKVVVCNKEEICIAFTKEEWPELVKGVQALAVEYLLDKVNKGEAFGVFESHGVLHFMGLPVEACKKEYAG